MSTLKNQLISTGIRTGVSVVQNLFTDARLNKTIGDFSGAANAAASLIQGTSTATKMHMSSVPGAAIIVLDRFGGLIDHIRFQIPPKSISDAKIANYSSQEILGRSEPLKAYTGSAPRTIGFVLEYHWYDFSGVGGWQFIETQLNKLQSLEYPRYTGATVGYQPPPKVLFYFGRRYKGVPCIVNSVSMDLQSPWVNPDNGDVRTGDVVPSKITVNCEFQVAYDVNDARGYHDIKHGEDGKSTFPKGLEGYITDILTAWTGGR